jgi:twitching motility protein PilT
MESELTVLLRTLHESGGSDLHVAAGSQPYMRIDGELMKVRRSAFAEKELETMLLTIMPEKLLEEFKHRGETDFCYSVHGAARYRVNCFRQIHGISAAFREIPRTVPTLDDLQLPPTIKDFAMLKRGLVLVTGATGSGKSTTLAAIVNHANARRKGHILTIEDPIEFVHTPKNCLISQREIGTHSKTFNAALRAGLREDPDIILLGEMRDLDTMRLAMEAAETGHLVLSTLHTSSAAKTVERIVGTFPKEEQDQARLRLAESIQAVLAQALVRNSSGRGRTAAVEIMVGNSAVRNLIRENNTHQINTVIQTNRKVGMQSMDDALQTLVGRGVISKDTAFDHAHDKQRFPCEKAMAQ